jgi:hypothetical protein
MAAQADNLVSGDRLAMAKQWRSAVPKAEEKDD